MNQCNEVKEKLSGYLDGELTQQKSQLIRVHLESCNECKQLHQELSDLQNKIKTITADTAEEAELDKIINDLGAKQSQHWGWIMLIIGYVMLAGYAIVKFLIDNQLNTFEKIATFLLGLGGLLLFYSVLRQRLIALKTDKYKDINL
ncbi:MAG: zf-HC2 domain-containing protein [Gammaproteobacteria bacterium]|nr:zf-HC2 domain-containing protein [Gammaproteobacteria bacterium]